MGQVSRAPYFDGGTVHTKDGGDFQLVRGQGHKSQSDRLERKCWLSHPRSLQLQKVYFKCLLEAPFGSAFGPGDCSNEIFCVCLDDGDILQLLHLTAQDFARGEAPQEVTRLFMMATLTAPSKPDGGVWGIATGTVLRLLVAKCLC